MPRQRLEPGEHGRITEWSSAGRHFAATYVRDADGKRRRVERSSEKSTEAARLILQRHLANRRAPLSGQLVTDKTTLAELFEIWLSAKVIEDGLKPQTVGQYRQAWAKHGAPYVGALRITELPTSRANAHIQAVAAGTPAQAKYIRIILRGMFGLAVRFDVLAVNPIRETKTPKKRRPPARAMTPSEFDQVRAAIKAYVERLNYGGPQPGRLLAPFIEVLQATGARPNEVLALRWSDVDLLADPPTVTISGTLIDHQRVAGKPLHRQEARKADAPTHTVVLPKFGIEALTTLLSETGPEGPVFANRNGGWMSLANMRRSLRAALPEELRWVVPKVCRSTVASVVRDDHGPALAQQQLSHAQLATTEAHYLQRQTRGPDVRKTLDNFAAGECVG
ncbi:tyrosine-type recombinase/integrase [Mycobacterium sp. 852002-40037_SCH5390672]|uniref:tyrosine-type recombinase/integrase n=1 Tax=Mycobacterium sp. 852002-40037_SCH5390672 TaxID=1834089 RepID=UPI0008054BA0|nr:tyrosine-type recombinase/integrase [Mycobacterium sp. 852002-40037_SCH5390672]OBB95387.1 integrase [Mycobacterium sp. 852002-40037_SCH5390672]